MKLTHDIKEIRDVLISGRGLALTKTPKWVSDSAYRIYGERMSLREYVQRIIFDVRVGGDAALVSLTEKIEGFRLENIEVSSDIMETAYKNISSDLRESLNTAANRIREFHELSKVDDWHDDTRGYGQKFLPVSSVSAYIPGGTARYPSTVLMTAIPARVAGVKRVSISCPGSGGGYPPDSVLAAAYISGVDQVYSLGGAQAIAALAYGTDRVESVDLICGPGNLFVTLAKKLVYGDVGIDGLYGPTETVILADETASPVMCAADLVAQAEHDVLATPVLITTSENLGREVSEQVQTILGRLNRSSIASRSIDERGLIAIVEDLELGIRLSNEFAPEHLSIVTKDPGSLLGLVENAGMVFLGELSHEVLGDYGAGPSHVMPTSGTARFNSGLGVHTFLKPVPIINLADAAAMSLSEVASIIAREEGLTGHAEAAEVRIDLR